VIGNNIWPQGVRKNLLHILPQESYHDSAFIQGSPEALRRLGNALIKASEMKQGDICEVEMMAADGECYAVEISPMSDQQMSTISLPYARLGHLWEFERCWNCDKARAALAEKENT
jgi:hypothetical protein